MTLENDKDAFSIDFGTDELNDPNYEEKVQDDGTLKTADDDQGKADPAPATDDGAPQTSDKGSDDAGTSDDGNKDAPAQQGQDTGGAPADKDDKPKVTQDKDGNLVDQDGKIVARAGAERRKYERDNAPADKQTQQPDNKGNVATQKYIRDLEGQVTQYKNAAAETTALNGIPKELGLSAQEVQTGLSAIAAFKKDPAGTARWLLQEAMQMGYDLPTIIGKDAQGQLNGGPLGMDAIKGMIAAELKPLIDDRNARTQQDDAKTDAEREYTKFIATHEHSSVHEDILAAMLNKGQASDPREAYWKLREYAAKHDLDFSKPLAEQMSAKRAQTDTNPATTGNADPNTQQQKTIPNGATPGADVQDQQVDNDDDNFGADDSWDKIVKSSMQKAGMLRQQ